VLILLFGADFLLSCNRSAGCYVQSAPSMTTHEEAVLEKDSGMRRVTIDVHHLDCSGCENDVESALKKVPGVIQVQPDAQEGVVIVQYDPKITNVEKLVELANKVNSLK